MNTLSRILCVEKNRSEDPVFFVTLSLRLKKDSLLASQHHSTIKEKVTSHKIFRITRKSGDEKISHLNG